MINVESIEAAQTSTLAAATPSRAAQRCRLRGHPWQEYYLYRPTGSLEGAPVLVAVHGISRNAREQAEAFADYAERYGVVVVAPLFPAERYPRYQQLGLSRHAVFPRPDLALDAILAEVNELTGARVQKFYLFGHSGGGQFAHRYAMAHPERVLAVAMGAPGWFTYPDRAQSFPMGIRKQSTAGLIRLRASRFLQIPMAVFVGSRDRRRDAALRVSGRLDAHQGDNRLERGLRWIETMREAARARGYATRYEFGKLPRCNHSFQRCVERGELNRRVFEFLFGQRDPARAKASAPHLVFHLP